MIYIVVILILVGLVFASQNKGKKVKVTIVQPQPNHDGKKIPLMIGNPVRVKGVGVGVVTDVGNYRVEVKFDTNQKKQWFFKSRIIRL